MQQDLLGTKLGTIIKFQVRTSFIRKSWKKTPNNISSCYDTAKACNDNCEQHQNRTDAGRTAAESVGYSKGVATKKKAKIKCNKVKSIASRLSVSGNRIAFCSVALLLVTDY